MNLHIRWLNLIKIENLTKRYQNNKILTNVNLEVNTGEIIIIVGPNGAGKSTFVKCLIDQTSYTGKIKISNSLTYVPEKIHLPLYITGFKFLKTILLVKQSYHEKEMQKLIYRFNLESHLYKPLKSLSYGTKQKLLIIQALLENVDIYLFDEPTNGLDEKSIEIFKEELKIKRSENKTIFIISHDKYNFGSLNPKYLKIENEKVFFIDKITY